jgi:hypothetical protein
MSNLNRTPSVDASYQVLVHLAKQFQRRRLLEIDQSETRIAKEIERPRKDLASIILPSVFSKTA